MVTPGGARYGGGASPYGEIDSMGGRDAGTAAIAPEAVSDGGSRDGGVSGVSQADKLTWYDIFFLSCWGT